MQAIKFNVSQFLVNAGDKYSFSKQVVDLAMSTGNMSVLRDDVTPKIEAALRSGLNTADIEAMAIEGRGRRILSVVVNGNNVLI